MILTQNSISEHRSIKTIKMEFEGYWPDDESLMQSIPERSGVYCMYTCKHSECRNKNGEKRLLYIGESHNVKIGYGRMKSINFDVTEE